MSRKRSVRPAVPGTRSLPRVFGFSRSPISAGHIPVFSRLLACMDKLVFVPPRACRVSKVWSGKNEGPAVFVSSYIMALRE